MSELLLDWALRVSPLGPCSLQDQAQGPMRPWGLRLLLIEASPCKAGHFLDFEHPLPRVDAVTYSSGRRARNLLSLSLDVCTHPVCAEIMIRNSRRNTIGEFQGLTKGRVPHVFHLWQSSSSFRVPHLKQSDYSPRIRSTGVQRSKEAAPPQDPLVGISLGPYVGPTGASVSYGQGTPIATMVWAGG